jgi:hypothetical protein
VLSPQPTRWSPNNHRSPGCVTGCAGTSGTNPLGRPGTCRARLGKPRLHDHIQFPSSEPDATGIVSECVDFSRNRDRPLAAQGDGTIINRNNEYHKYGLIMMITPMPRRFRLPRATKHRDPSGSTRPPRHGKLRGLVRVSKYLFYMAVSDLEQTWLDRPPLFIDGKFRRRRSTTGIKHLIFARA